MANDIRPGSSFPLGATPTDDGVNFSLFSKNATHVELVFFDTVDARQPCRVIGSLLYAAVDVNPSRVFHEAGGQPLIEGTTV